jgi:hypothetical protein
VSGTDRHTSVEVQQVPPDVFFADAKAFDGLLTGSDQDALFNGYAWQSSWWDAFGEMHGLEPMFLEARNLEGRLVGRLALVRRRARDLGLPVRTLELLGNLWRGPATLRSEFLDLVADQEHRSDVVQVIVNHVFRQIPWDEWILQDLDDVSALSGAVRARSGRRTLVRLLSEDRGFEIRIDETLEHFKHRLSANARRKLFAQRARLESLGAVSLMREPVENASAFEELDRLHEQRWGAPLLGGGRARFLALLSSRLGPGAVTISELRVGASVISSLLQVRVGNREINLQGGFDADAAGRTSPSRLHWGYLIEDAFAQRKVDVLDLLAGGGKAAGFKEDFANDGRRMVTLQVVRQPLLAAAHRARRMLRAERSNQA